MKALCLTTGTRNCETLWRSFECLGHECHPHRYDDRPHARHDELVDLARDLRPDIIIYIGAIEQSPECKPVPRPDIFLQLKECAPIVHLCGDASDKPWWSWLENYDRLQCFSAQVSMDGNFETPISHFSNGLVLLSPMDNRVFRPAPWEQRTTQFGLVGGQGHTKRQSMILELQRRGILQFSDSSFEKSYAVMAEIMNNTKITLNVPFNGTGDRMHIKGRVIEAGLAGCCLLEGECSPTASWFSPGLDYLEYDNLDRVVHLVNEIPDEQLQAMAERFHKRVVAEHGPDVFWAKVLKVAGIACQ